MDAHYNDESNLQSISAILEYLLFYQKSTIVYFITIIKYNIKNEKIFDKNSLKLTFSLFF